ncbi:MULTISPECIES: hypothetical protein [unclassified Nostoc]|uniref:hypothetical protein n=1 Tax=unclassified Nostoc TaxID=2593658 RepID=UPI00159F0FD9|nr:hypothetical protein [Nostoc sp. KVJ20]
MQFYRITTFAIALAVQDSRYEISDRTHQAIHSKSDRLLHGQVNLLLSLLPPISQ